MFEHAVHTSNVIELKAGAEWRMSIESLRSRSAAGRNNCCQHSPTIIVANVNFVYETFLRQADSMHDDKLYKNKQYPCRNSEDRVA